MSETDVLKPCPFCGTELKDFPEVMIVRPVHSDEYLIKKIENKKIIGSDSYFAVHCIQCGVVGKRGYTKEEAKKYWNRRSGEQSEDSIEVVRCKDCTKGFRKFLGRTAVVECQLYHHNDKRQYKDPMDYCSHACRRCDDEIQ